MDSLPVELKTNFNAWSDNPILKRCKSGVGGGTSRPFFSRNDKEIVPNFETFDHEIKLPPIVQEAMRFWDAATELYVNAWTIMSINEMKFYRDAYLKNKQTLVTPIAYQYHGMGHVKVLAYCDEIDVTFTYMDGGANGYDRHNNFLNIINLTEKDIEESQVGLSILWEYHDDAGM